MKERKPHASIFFAAQAEKTRQKILAFYRENPFATQEQCGLAVGVSSYTVRKHVAVLKARMQEDMRV